MVLRVVGAGLGRTGTTSLRTALEQVLDEPCFHMNRVMRQPAHMAVFAAAAKGESIDWRKFFAGWSGCVDWPACAFWSEIADTHPNALVLLSTRESPEAWWASVEKTIAPLLLRLEPLSDRARAEQMGIDEALAGPWFDMVRDVLSTTFAWPLDDGDRCMRAYEEHNRRVEASVPADRLLRWQPGDGWKPLCEALDVPIPDEPFPSANDTEAFRSNLGLT